MAGILFLVLIVSTIVATTQAFRLAHQRDREATARTTSEQVTDVLISLFEGADPTAADRSDITLREILEAGVDRIKDELEDQPLVQAKLMQVLGGVYNKLADYPQSQELLESAVAIQRRQLGDDHPDVATTLIHLGKLHRQPANFGDARTLLTEALAIRLKTFGPDHELIAEAHDSLGALAYHEQDYPAAALHYKEALAMQRRVHGEQHLEVAVSLQNLGLTVRQMREVDRAESLLRQSLAMKRQLLGDHRELLVTLQNLAHVAYFSQVDAAAAADYLHQRLELARRLMDSAHPELAAALNDLAFMVERTEDLARAEK